MITSERIDEYMAIHEEIEEAANQALKWYAENVKEPYGYKYLSFSNLEYGTLQYEGYEPAACGCCGGDDHSFELDSRVLYDEEYKQKLIEGERKVREAKEREANERKAKEKERKRKQDLELLTALKEKYE